MRVRRFRLPVLSRLAWAWLAFAAIAAAATLFASADIGRTRALVAMAVEGVERLAPPVEHTPISDPVPERLARGEAAISALPAADAPDAEDALGGISDGYWFHEDPADDVVITIDGAPARAINEARNAAGAAGWTPIAAPDASLLKRSAYGQIPVVAADGRKASHVYAQPFTPRQTPHVALIVGGLGLNRALTERAIDELPPYVTLAFAPYAKDLPFWTKRARSAGHEVMIELPMENRAGDEETLGPAALLTSRTPEQNELRLEWILSRFQGYFGVTNYLGSKFSADKQAMERLLARLDAAGLAYVDDTGALSRLRAKDGAAVDRVIDPGFGGDKTLIRRDLESLEKVAARNGDALGKTYVHDRTLSDIASWASSLEERELTLAPASAVLALRAGDR